MRITILLTLLSLLLACSYIHVKYATECEIENMRLLHLSTWTRVECKTAEVRDGLQAKAGKK